ncbi:MAG: DNA primase [Rhodocyclaceae bacterium]|nr:DNA primase [Rhodocyclaceae bacterium]
MIPESFIQELLARIDIVEIIDRVVPLKKAGANYAACCPFHKEKSPSFTVSPAKQFYHCFGCGAHGTAIGFLMEHQGLSFPDAIEDLARHCGLTVPQENNDRAFRKPSADSSEGPSLLDVMLTAHKYYRDELKKSPRAIAYLKGRGLTGEIAARFGIGYAPDGWQNLRAVFPEYDNDHFQALIKDGLVIENEQKRRYDRFRDRVMFPILDQKGQVIAFGGRILDQGEPKYLNSPETPLFEKGREVFGLPQAREVCRQTDTVIVVEGYMDVVALAQHGIGNAVATLGTATTTTHIRKLLRMVDRVVFCFDGDAAGRKAAWRALENSLEALAEQKVLAFAFLPPEHDPDSYVRDLGKEAFQAAIDRATPLSEFLLQTLCSHVDLSSAEGRAKLLAEAKPLLQKIPTPMLRLQIVKQLAEKTGLQPAEVERGCELSRQAVAPSATPGRAPRQAPSLSRRLLRVLVQSPELLADLPADFANHLPSKDPLTPNIRRLLPLLASNPQPSELLERVRGSEDAPLLAEIFASLLTEPLEKAALSAELDGIVAQIERDQLDAELATLQQAAQRGSLNPTEKARYAAVLQSLQQLGRTGRRR